jgi:hypothetical protein
VRNHDASSYDQRYVDRFFLFGTGHAQTIGLNHVILDAVVAAQTGRRNEPHQLFVFRRNSTFEIGIVIQIVEAFDEEVIGFVDVFVPPSALVDKMPGECTLVSSLFLGKQVGRFLAVSKRVFGAQQRHANAEAEEKALVVSERDNSGKVSRVSLVLAHDSTGRPARILGLKHAFHAPHECELLIMWEDLE